MSLCSDIPRQSPYPTAYGATNVAVTEPNKTYSEAGYFWCGSGRAAFGFSPGRAAAHATTREAMIRG